MKSIYILDDYYLSAGSGIGTYLKHLILCAAPLEEVRIFIIELRTNEPCFRICRLETVEYILLPAIHEKKLFDQCEEICQPLRIHIKDSKDNIFMFNYTPSDRLMKALRSDFPLSRFIFTVHDMSWTAPLLGDEIALKKSLPSFFSQLDREITQFQLADQVVCLSEDTYRVLQQYYQVSTEKIYLISNGINEKTDVCSEKEKIKLKQKMYLREEEPVILLVGRISEAKGSFAYLHAFRQVLKTAPLCKLVIIGEIYNPAQVMELVKPIAAKVIFTGKLYADELRRWYRIADLGVLPSYTEQCSYVGLEMMRHKLPVVASDGFGIRCMFREGMNACIAPIGNRKRPEIFKKNLVTATLQVLRDAQMRIDLGKTGYRILKQQYSLSIMSQKYQELWLNN